MTNPERGCPDVKKEGFTELYPRGTIDANEITADLIFVHGLMGHPRNTWQCGKTPKETKSRTHTLRFWRNKDKAGQSKHDQVTSENVCYWPFDLLRLDFKHVRILTYGYDSHPSHFCTGPTNRMTISQHAENLLKKIVDIRSGHATRPIIFVAHSLGGILVKDAIVESRKFFQNSQNVRMGQVYEQCRAIFFFGTPHSGATLAEWGLLLSRILGSIPGPDTYEEILRGLSPDSEKLEMVTKDFNDVLDADVPKWKKIMICSLCEGKGMSGLNVLHTQVVPTHSATFGRRDVEERVFIQKNHMHMCQFESMSDPGYESFKSTLVAYLDDIQQAKTRAEDVSSKEQHTAQDLRRAALLKSLDFADRRMRENQLWDIQANPKTFDWIWSSSFAQWLSSSDDLFWICGKPASGKSTLIHHLTQNKEVRTRLSQILEADWITVRHFFDFRARIEGKSVRNTFQGFLRSLLFQLISTTAGIVRNDDIGQNYSERHVEQHWSDGDLFKRLKICLNESPRPICIFVDGVDEYASGLDDIEDRQWDLVDFLKDISGPRSKLCIASRPEKVFLTAFAQVPSLRMQDWNHEGIRQYAGLTLTRSLAPSGFYEHRELVSLSEDIAARSEGVFLWAHFAINQLRNGWARADDLDMPSLRKKLDDVPSELDQIYSRIFQSMHPDDRRSVGYMLQLICYARRVLSLDELWVATERVNSRETVALTAWHLKRFEQRVYAITGGILDIFWTERETRDEHDMRYGYRLPDCVEEGGSDKYVPFGKFWIARGDPVVALIHRSVQSFLDSKGWSTILHSTKEIALQSEKLWLRLCSEEFSGTATARDSTFAAADSIIAFMDNMDRVKTRLHDGYVREAGKVRRLLLAGDDTNDLYGSTSFMTESDLEKYLDKRAISLQQYAALFMLNHASTVEQSFSISSYPIIRAAITTLYLQSHAFYWSFLSTEWCKHCRFRYGLELNPVHPLHLAVAHGLNLYVSEFLTSNKDCLLSESYMRRRHSASFFTSYYKKQFPDLVEFLSRNQRIELLELAVFYANDPSMISTILKHRKLDADAALVMALYEGKSIDVIQCLLQYKAASGRIILSPPNLQYSDAFQDQPDEKWDDHENDGDEGSKNTQITTWNYPNLLATPPNVGPLWVVARCHPYPIFPWIDEILDLFLSRGEDINGICGPFGTALHAAMSKPEPLDSFLSVTTILLERGADINASGPLGTPLELLWVILGKESRTYRQNYGIRYCENIKNFINDERSDNYPESWVGLPTVEQMREFCQL